MNTPRISKKARPAPITLTYDDYDDSASSPSSLSPSTTEMTTDSDTHSEASHHSSSSQMPLTKARLERVLDVHHERKKKRASTPASAPANGIFTLGWWRDSSDESESEDEYPPTPMAGTPRVPESPPRLFRPISPRPKTPISARPTRPVTPRSARPSVTPRSPAAPKSPMPARPMVTPRSPLSARPTARAFMLSPTRAEPMSLGQIAVQLQQQDTPKAPKFRRRPTELKLDSRSSESEEFSTSPSSASSSSAPPSPPDSLPPSPSVLNIDTPMPDASELLSPLSPSSQFCARNASLRIKDHEGYVSFGAIEGLGMPDMDDESHRHEEPVEKTEDSRKSGSWTPRWLTPWKKP